MVGQGMIFRNDDVNRNTDMDKLNAIYRIIRNYFPAAEILTAVSIFSKYSKSEAVYPSLPLKGKPLDYFLNVDQVVRAIHTGCDSKVVSHGLWHFDHTSVDQELAKASIITSCRLLYTDIFVPPFNKWDNHVERICAEAGIQLIKSNEDGWRSIEFNPVFDPRIKNWYLHSWRWTPESLAEYFEKSHAS